jgi:Tol biopolymer transport system component
MVSPALSGDGKRLAVAIRDPGSGRRDIWVFDLERDTASRLTFDPADDLNAAWSPDGTRIAFTSDRRGHRDLYVKKADGTGPDDLLLESATPKSIENWSPDGRWIAYNENNGNDIWTLAFDKRKPEPFLRTPFREQRPRFSPDGRWVAYNSNETGHAEVYVQPFPPAGGKWQISTNGGSEPQWRGPGKEIFFLSADPVKMMAVDVASKEGRIQAGIPHALFDFRLDQVEIRNHFAVSRNGQKFLAVVPRAPTAGNILTVILNWQSLLRIRPK